MISLSMVRIIYYAEVNLICIVVLLLLRRQLDKSTGYSSTSAIVFGRIIVTAMVLCAADAAACISGGMTFPGARLVVEASNMVYFEAMAAVSFQWLRYVRIKIDPAPISALRQWLWAIPLIVITAMIATNPLTHYIFSVGKDNQYLRGPGVLFHWLVMWLYLAVSVVLTAQVMLHEKRKYRRCGLAPLLQFIIAPVVCGILQMLVYGVTTTQVGITISLLVVFLTSQSGQVLTDALTGLNNRRAFDRYLMDYLQHHSAEELSLVMLDINDFKQVNDRFGHMMGDRALQDTAHVLRQICVEAAGTLFLCRYGGDEFLIAGIGRVPREDEQLKTTIHTELDRKAASQNTPYALKVGIGLAAGRCADMEDAEHLLHVADEAMYEDKKNAKRAAASVARL